MKLWQYILLFAYKLFASLCCIYLGVAPISYVQDTILNLFNTYLYYTLNDSFIYCKRCIIYKNKGS